MLSFFMISENGVFIFEITLELYLCYEKRKKKKMSTKLQIYLTLGILIKKSMEEVLTKMILM